MKKKIEQPTLVKLDPGEKRRHICEDMGCNVFGRLDNIRSLLDSRNFDIARREMIELANFLPGNLVVTIGDDDQALLDMVSEDDE